MQRVNKNKKECRQFLAYSLSWQPLSKPLLHLREELGLFTCNCCTRNLRPASIYLCPKHNNNIIPVSSSYYPYTGKQERMTWKTIQGFRGKNGKFFSLLRTNATVFHCNFRSSTSVMVETVPAEQGCFYSSLKYTVLQNYCVFPETEPRLKEELQILIKYLKSFPFFHSVLQEKDGPSRGLFSSEL